MGARQCPAPVALHARDSYLSLAPLPRGQPPSAPARYGSPEQQRRWLVPLLRGQIRSCFAMTEKEVASSDATNITAAITRAPGRSYAVKGIKWWTSGAMDPRCKVRRPARLVANAAQFAPRGARRRPPTSCTGTHIPPPPPPTPRWPCSWARPTPPPQPTCSSP